MLALGGSASYLSAEDWGSLPRHANGRYVLSVYAEGHEPFTADLDAQALDAAREQAREFADSHGGRLERIGRFDVVAIRP